MTHDERQRLIDAVIVARHVRQVGADVLAVVLGNVQLLIRGEYPACEDPEVMESLRAAETHLGRLALVLRRLDEISL